MTKCDSFFGQNFYIQVYTLLGVVGLLDMLFIPFLWKHLNGMRRMCLILQQICSVIYLGSIVTQIYTRPTKNLNIMTTILKEQDDYLKSSLLSAFLEWIQAFAYHQFYILALICSYDIYQLICFPLQYKEFSNKKNISKILISSTIISTLMTSHIILGNILNTMVRSFALSPQKVLVGTLCLHVAKTFILRLTYFIAALFMTKKCKKVFENSVELSNNQERQTLFRRLYRFLLIPIFLNSFAIAHDCVETFGPLFTLINRCQYGYDTLICISAVIFTISSLVYFFGYVILIPSIQKAFCCCSFTMSRDIERVRE